MTPERIEQLLAGHAAGDLDAVEQAELRAACRTDPALQAELDRLDRLAADLRAIGAVRRSPAPAGLEEAVVAATRRPRSTSPSKLVRLLAAVIPALLVIAVGISAVRGPADDGPAPATFGLGEVEPITFVQGRAELVVESAVVAHTWGTEVVLVVDGLPDGQSYDVTLLGPDGAVSAGSFLGTGGIVDCRLNGAVLRQDVTAVRVTDAAGRPVLTAPL